MGNQTLILVMKITCSMLVETIMNFGIILKTVEPPCSQHPFDFSWNETTYVLKTPHIVFLHVIFPSFLFGRSIDMALIGQWSIPTNVYISLADFL